MLSFAIALAVVAGLLAALPPRAVSSVPANGRVWELMTFSEPNSVKLLSIDPLTNNGETLAYRTFGPLPGAQSGAFLGSGIARRGPTGWSNTPIGFPFLAFSTELFSLLAPEVVIGLSEDLQESLWLASVPLSPDGPPEEQLGLYWQTGDEPPRFIARLGEGLTFFYEGFADLSHDGSSVIFTSPEHLLPEDAGRTQGESVYRWDQSGLSLVDVDSGGALLSACGSQVSSENGMSVSGRRVFFTQPPEVGCAETKKVYLRDSVAGTTVEISASQCTRVDCNAPQDVTFEGATPSGGSAFLVTAQQLTDDDQDAGRDLYRYDAASGQLSLLSGGSPALEGEVDQTVVYPSDNGARVYFRATGVMISGETSTAEKLYYADDSGIHLVAEATFLEEPQIQLSEDGHEALFVTASKVTGDDTDEMQDTYLYDASDNHVTKISAGPSGGNGSFDANLASIESAGFFYGDKHVVYGIDASGDRAFFTTAESLVPADVNSKLDVYEWKDGQLGLVTPGSEEVDSSFGGVSRDGRAVIFGTSASLVPTDLDGGDTDFYSAQLGGGFPEPQQPPACDGGSCSRAARAPLARQGPGSAKLPAGKHPKRIRLLDIRSPDAGSAVGGKTSLVVAVPVPGLVSASVWIRREGKKVQLARGRQGVVRPGKVSVRLHLTAAGREGAGDVRKGHLSVSEDGAVGVSRLVDLSLGGGNER